MNELRLLKNHLERYLDKHEDEPFTIGQFIKFIEELEKESVKFCTRRRP